MGSYTPLISGHVLTETFTNLGPIGTGPGTASPPLGAILTHDLNPGSVFQFGKWLSATTGAAGNVVFSSFANSFTLYPQWDKEGAASTGLDSMAGVLMGAPTQNQYAWIQKSGISTTVLIEGTVNIVLGDSLKGVSGQLYAVHDQALGTAPSYPNHIRALAGYTGGAGTATLAGAAIHCLRS